MHFSKMDFPDVVFLPSRASLSTKYPKTVLRGKLEHTPCEILLFQQSLFIGSVEFQYCYKDEVKSGHPWFGGLDKYKIVVSVCLSLMSKMSQSFFFSG